MRPGRQRKMGPCFWCGRQTFRRDPDVNDEAKYTRDHLIPRRMRSTTYVATIGAEGKDFTVTSCLACNLAKGNKDARVFAATLRLAKEKLAQIEFVYNSEARTRRERGER